MNPEMRALFDEEAARHVESARSAIAAAGARPDALIDALRALHSIKGMAAALGLSEIVAIAHGAEDVVRDAKELAAANGATPQAPLVESIERLDAALARHRATEDDALVRARGSSASLRIPPARVSADTLDRLVEHVQSLTVWVERLEHRLGDPADGPSLVEREEMRRSLRSLTREIDGIRLHRVGDLAPVLRTAVAAWAAARGVAIAFDVEGARVRADRALFERLFDPIGQLLRNAVVHGGESPATRRARGLAEATRVVLGAARDAGRLTITVTDDGPGLDPDAVRRRAVACGAISEAEASALDDRAALALLTHPTFAARGEADTLRGRGVGLAAVRAAAEHLGGTLSLASARGVGFKATITVPLLLALSDAFLVESGGLRLAIIAEPVTAVRPGSYFADERVDLARWLGRRSERGAEHALVIEHHGVSSALVVDRVIERREFAIRRLGPPLDRHGPWIGAALLADGGLALALDPRRVVAMPLPREAASLRE